MEIIKTYLPLFPGFYETGFDFDPGCEFDSAIEHLGYSTDLSCNIDDVAKVDYNQYREDVAKACVTAVYDALGDVVEGLDKITFESIRSPKY